MADESELTEDYEESDSRPGPLRTALRTAVALFLSAMAGLMLAMVAERILERFTG